MRPRETVSIETRRGQCKLYSNVEFIADMHGPATVTLQVGDDGSWRDLSRIFYPGEACKLFCNGRLLFTGRFETNKVPTNPSTGAIAHIVARTRLADARYTTAKVDTKVTDVSIKQFILAIFVPLGFKESDFVFDATADRNLVTGVRGRDKAPVDLETMQESKAKVQPGETIYDAATRHLKRYHLAMWDGADGKIVVGAPNDSQVPIFTLRAKRGGRSSNNLSMADRTRDWAEVAQRIEVVGKTSGDSADATPLKGVATDDDVTSVFNKTGHFSRVLSLALDGPKTTEKAQAQAQRELASRRKEKDAWSLQVDSWSFWDGHKLIPWALNTTIDVDVDSIGVEGAGRFLIHKITRGLDTNGGATCSLEVAAPGILEF
jgi:hypothetical protein